MKHVAIVGSRNFASLGLVAATVSSLAAKLGAQNLTIVSGGAKGVDAAAEVAARALGVAVESIKPDWDKYGKTAGFLRNTEIIERADVVIAFWNGISRGTMDSVRKAAERGKKVTVLNDQGKIVGESQWPKAT